MANAKNSTASLHAVKTGGAGSEGRHPDRQEEWGVRGATRTGEEQAGESNSAQIRELRELPGGPLVKTALPTQTARVPPLVGGNKIPRAAGRG